MQSRRFAAMRLAIRVFIVVLAVVLVVPQMAPAKRGSAAKVEPVVHEGVRYSAPNDDGRRAYVATANARTGEPLGNIVIFTTFIKPWKEEDAQWVFIEKLAFQDGALIVTDEKEREYRVDVKTRKVKRVGE